MALVGYAWSLAGMTRAQRTVRAAGRIERVGRPRDGGSKQGGIPVVVSYQDPATGRPVTVTNEADGGNPITAAWEGREVGVSHPPGRPHRVTVTDDRSPGGRGLGWPNFAVFLGYAGAVTATAIDRGWPWALIGICGPWAVVGAFHLPGNVRDARRRRDELAAMQGVPGRVVAVLRDVTTDAEGSTLTTLTPVVAFTTREGVDVTAYCASGVPDPENARGREVTVHYAPADPAVFTTALATHRRSVRTGNVVDVVGVLVVAAAAVVGAALV